MNRTEKLIARLILLILISVFIFLMWGCNAPKLAALQTGIHDIAVQLETNRIEKGVYNNLKKDCDLEQVTFGKDSFAFYTKCPNEAKPIRRTVIKKSYELVNGE